MRFLLMKWLIALLILVSLPVLAQELPGDVQSGPSLWSHQTFKKSQHDFNFAIIADRTGGERPLIFTQAIDALNNLQPAFVMCIGDLSGIYTTDEAALHKQFDTIDASITKLKMPFHYTPGNHDIPYTIARKVYKEHYGRTYSYFIYDNVLFLTLDTTVSEYGSIDDEQVAYFQQVIAAHPEVRWTMLFMHHPIWKSTGSNWEKITAALKGRQYTVFAGHTHVYESSIHDGMHYYILATTGGDSLLRGLQIGEFDHIAWVSMTDDGPSITNLLIDGIVKDNIRDEATARIVDAVMNGSRVTCLPVVVGDNGAKRVIVSLKFANQTDYPLHYSGHIGNQLFVKTTPETIDVTLQPKQTQTVKVVLECRIPITREALATLPYTYSVTYDNGTEAPITIPQITTEITCFEGLVPHACARRTIPVTIDGKLDEWKSLPYHSGKVADCAFQFATAYDEKYVYVAVKVDDNDVCSDPTKFPWEQDGLEIRFLAGKDPDRSQWKGAGYRSDDRELLIPLSPGETAEKTVCLEWGKLPDGTKKACVKTSTGYNAEVAIPVEYFNARQDGKWQAFRLNIAANYADNGVWLGQVWWCPDWRKELTVDGSGTFTRK